jgi:hypothetical protein
MRSLLFGDEQPVGVGEAPLDAGLGDGAERTARDEHLDFAQRAVTEMHRWAPAW